MARSGAAGASSAALAAALATVAFWARGGVRLDRTGLVEALLVVAGGAIVALALMRGRGGRLHGTGAIAGLGAYVFVLALSVSWSITPDISLSEAGRGFAYLAVFSAAVMAVHAWPGTVEVTARALFLAAVAICGWALITRVFPGSLAELVVGARLGAPFDYWNSLASVATIGLVPALWFGTRPTSSPLARASALPAVGMFALVLALTQSRGGIIATAIALAVWFAVVPFRLRSLAVLVIPVLAMLPIAVWALSKDVFTEPLQPLADREAIAGTLGTSLVLLLVGLFAVGLLIERLAGARPLSLINRRRIGLTAFGVACLIPLIAFGAVAASDRGLRGPVDDLTTSKKSAPPRGAARLGSADSARGAYWGEALHVFADEPFHGDGAGSFEVSRLRHRDDLSIVQRAHSFIFQTLADTGVLGLLAALAALVAWLVAAARSLSFSRRAGPGAGPGWPDERVALTALALAVLAFGIQSGVDFVWLVPAPAVMALTAAGVVAGRGPLPALGSFPPLPEPQLPRPERIVWSAAIFLTALICAWAVWQPARAQHHLDQSLERLTRHDTKGALSSAEDALKIEPESLAALMAIADAQAQARQPARELATLKLAVKKHPRNPKAWNRLGFFEAEQLHRINDVRRIAVIMNELDPRGGAPGVLIGWANLNAAALLKERQGK